eukprot:SAG31_NODE_1531_length_7992_cov_2.794121_4_plen_183_part_00
MLDPSSALLCKTAFLESKLDPFRPPARLDLANRSAACVLLDATVATPRSPRPDCADWGMAMLHVTCISLAAHRSSKLTSVSADIDSFFREPVHTLSVRDWESSGWLDKSPRGTSDDDTNPPETSASIFSATKITLSHGASHTRQYGYLFVPVDATEHFSAKVPLASCPVRRLLYPLQPMQSK